MNPPVMLHVENDLEMFKLKVFCTYIKVNTFYPILAFYWIKLVSSFPYHFMLLFGLSSYVMKPFWF